ncbi:hypothetical protein [Lactococcus lactis]|uniref:hypothetical protein n=1 Tax=Lactococcus lactis TaxID=1358 RepID=UPI0022E88F5C|nr:hypothetical protein [Lactococcus lactis]
MSDEITFYEIVSHDSDYNPLTTIGKFQNLGNFSKTLSKFRRENVETIYLIILNDTFFTLRVNTFEEIMIFLKKQGWYDEKPDNFIIKQLYLEFIDEDDNWEDKGVHPLDQQDKVEQLLKNYTIWDDSEGENKKIELEDGVEDNITKRDAVICLLALFFILFNSFMMSQLLSFSRFVIIHPIYFIGVFIIINLLVVVIGFFVNKKP